MAAPEQASSVAEATATGESATPLELGSRPLLGEARSTTGRRGPLPPALT